MESKEIRKKFLNFFEQRGHTIISSSSLIPDDPSVLLTTAGMQQFKKYYTGEGDPVKDFGSKDTASLQKSFRTTDIDNVGDESHLTFFEMLGNFSFGGYFKKEAIAYAHDFFKAVNLPLEYVTIFGGDKEVPPDEESEKIWKSLGVSIIEKRSRTDNFWGPTGNEGPCGPTTELYANGTEIWNIVFNQYYCKQDKSLTALQQSGVDTGMGLERLAMVLQKKKNIFATDLFAPLLGLLPEVVDQRHQRVIVDHLRGTAFLLADGLRPSNKETGYILRRLMRRVYVYEHLYKIPLHVFDAILHDVIHEYGGFYPELLRENEAIREEFKFERERFVATLDRGLRELTRFKEKYVIDALASFSLYQTYGLPFEIIKELGGEKAVSLTREDFDQEFKKHQEISRAGKERKFGGHGITVGDLTAANEEELKIKTRLHTATHLLNAALHKILGDEVSQRGSDITVERTRFDFLFSRKMTPEEIKGVEDLVNEAIVKNYRVEVKEMPLEEAKKAGALFFYRGHYPDMVTVYTIANEKEIFSRELCGGPHVSSTAAIGHFRIIKEESSSAGVRRIRAIIGRSE